ncbi:hypothetical protein J5N97_023155 [Dioscorea zingiberensis]|uniref:Protein DETOXIFICATION n=1 Tax=Dioscorea zingiberensis TaxID=325984 RepID=A0A9D5HBN6_9LILI|nr:hypothetical protein J5N97_023155 [Dioscorea zingiberensis]
MEEERGLMEKGRRGGEDEEEVRSIRDAIRVGMEESKRQWKVAGPIAVMSLFTFGIYSSIQILAGHLSALHLSAVSTALTLDSIFTVGLLLGLGSALETLCGQAFGAGQIGMLGIYIQRTWIILVISSIIVSPVYIFATTIFSLLGQQPDIAALAGWFELLILPHIFALAISYPCQKFLLTQSKVMPLACIGCIGFVLHVILLWLFIPVLGWGLTGAAAAFDVSSWAIALFQVIYIKVWCKGAWNGLSWLAFKDLWPFVKLSFSNALMALFSDLYGALIVLITGLLNNAKIALGSLSICVRVSNELGSDRPRAVKYAIIVSGCTTLCIGLLSSILILATWDKFALLFTSSKEVQDSASTAVYLLAILLVTTGFQCTLLGATIGGGWQVLVAYINLGCLYFIGIPLAVTFGFLFHWGVQGIWVGMLCGSITQTLILLTLVGKINWKSQVLDYLVPSLKVLAVGLSCGFTKGADHDSSLPEILKSATNSAVDLDVRKDNGSDIGSESGEDFEERLVDVTFINYSSDYDKEREQARDNVNKYVQLKRSIQDNVDESDNEDGDGERPVDCLARTSEVPPVTEDGKGHHTGGLIIGREVPQNSSFITASELMGQRNRRIVAAKIQTEASQQTSTTEFPDFPTQQSMTTTAAEEKD